MDLSNIAPSISLELKADALEYLIREGLKNHIPGYEVDEVTFSTSKEYDMRGDTCGTRFTGAKVTFKKASVVTAGWEGTHGIPYSPETLNKLEK
jgi:hypothetical protein